MNTGVIWFRNALRLNDNRVLVECLNSTNSQTILPLYILDKNDLEQNNNENRIKFLYESLIDLDANFKNKFGSNLIVLNGKSEEVFRKLLGSDLIDISEIFCFAAEVGLSGEIRPVPKTVEPNRKVCKTAYSWHYIQFSPL